MNNSIIMAGDEAFNIMIKQLSKYKFVNLMIDAATVHNMRVVHSTLSNPFSQMAPIPFRTVQKLGSDWKIDDYQNEIETAISEIENYNSNHFENDHIKIVAICHDRLPSQSSAISKVISNIKQHNKIIPITDVSCLNHLIHNSFLGALNNCSEFRKLISQIDEFVPLLRKRDAVAFIGKKIPNPPKNRWIYIEDVLSFLVFNIDSVNNYLLDEWYKTHFPEEGQTFEQFEKQAKNESCIKKDFIELFIILLPMQKASLSFECESSTLSDVIPVIQVLLKSYQTIKEKALIELESILIILHELLAQLMSRLETYLPKETWASFAFSRAGRYYLRMQNAASGLVNGNICDYTDESFSVNDASDDMEKEINDTLNIISQNGGTLIEEEEEDDIEVSDNNESLNRIIQSGDSEEILSLPNDQNIDKSTFDAINLECNLNAKFRNKLIEWRGKELTDMINTNIAFRTYDIALEVVNELCISFDEQCTVEQINTIFDEWLFNSNNTFPVRDMNLENDFIIWQNFYKHDRLRTLSLVALRLLSIGTSESNVERLISIHRYLIHDRMTNISPEVLLARLRMRAKAITDNYIMK